MEEENEEIKKRKCGLIMCIPRVSGTIITKKIVHCIYVYVHKKKKKYSEHAQAPRARVNRETVASQVSNHGVLICDPSYLVTACG